MTTPQDAVSQTWLTQNIFPAMAAVRLSASVMVFKLKTPTSKNANGLGTAGLWIITNTKLQLCFHTAALLTWKDLGTKSNDIVNSGWNKKENVFPSRVWKWPTAIKRQRKPKVLKSFFSSYLAQPCATVGFAQGIKEKKPKQHISMQHVKYVPIAWSCFSPSWISLLGLSEFDSLTTRFFASDLCAVVK